MIKAVFIDWGNVFEVFPKNREKKLDAILKPFGFTWKKFHPIWRQFYILRSAGNIKSDKDLEIYINRVVQKKISVKEIIRIKIDTHIIPKDHIESVKELKKKYKVAILSNYVEGWLKQVLGNYKIGNLFDAIIVSSVVGERKPGARIYYEALKSLSVKPEESVFVADEVAEDLVVASGLGMKTIWFNAKAKGWWGEDDRKVLKIYKPDAVVKNFKEIVPIVRKMR